MRTSSLEARFHLPELPHRPALGSMCCLVPMEDLIRDELRLWPGVEEVNVDQETCQVHVQLATNHPLEADLVWSLDKLGFTDIRTEQFPENHGESHEGDKNGAGTADA